MRRAKQAMNTERALTLALVLVAVGYGPGAIPHLIQRSASTSPTAAYASSRAVETCTSAHESERRPTRVAPDTVGELPTAAAAVAGCRSRETVAPRATRNRSAFLIPPSERGPPVLG
jgi:hypothetical protein